MKLAIFFPFVLFIMVSAASAQRVTQIAPANVLPNSHPLPYKVEPVPIHEIRYSGHRFFDTRGKVTTGAVFGAATRDAVGTCRTLASGGYEYVLPTQRCAPATAMILAGAAADISLAYIFHRTGHHTLERITQFAGVANSAAGIGLTQHLGGRW